MDTLDYTAFDSDHNYPGFAPVGLVTKSLSKSLTTGQRMLLSMLPERGDVILLDDAISVVGITDERAYAQIVILMNRGALCAEFADLRSVDREIVLRRL